jgi:hypothetical protein
VLAREPGAIVAEAPFPIPQQWFLNAPYMVNSTRHWQPLLNGYSGFRPPSYERSYEAMQTFPSDEIIAGVVAARRDPHRRAPARDESRPTG